MPLNLPAQLTDEIVGFLYESNLSVRDRKDFIDEHLGQGFARYIDLDGTSDQYSRRLIAKLSAEELKRILASLPVGVQQENRIQAINQTIDHEFDRLAQLSREKLTAELNDLKEMFGIDFVRILASQSLPSKVNRSFKEVKSTAAVVQYIWQENLIGPFMVVIDQHQGLVETIKIRFRIWFEEFNGQFPDFSERFHEEVEEIQYLELEPNDYLRLQQILRAMPEWQLPRDRVDLMRMAFRGVPQADDILSEIDYTGSPNTSATRTIDTLVNLGHAQPDKEALGCLVTTMLELVENADNKFLQDLLVNYPFDRSPPKSIEEWRGYDDSETVLEKIVGRSIPTFDVGQIKLGIVASDAVVRILVRNGVMTGFLCGENLVMTLGYLSFDLEAAPPLFQFYYELDLQGYPRSPVDAQVRPGGVFHRNKDLNFSVMEIESVPDGINPLSLAMSMPPPEDERVTIIHHPQGQYKKISMEDNFVTYSDSNVLQYLTPTEGGSTGAPLFNDDFDVVGIHSMGGMLLEPGSFKRQFRNAGTSSLSIIADLQASAPEIYKRLRLVERQ